MRGDEVRLGDTICACTGGTPESKSDGRSRPDRVGTARQSLRHSGMRLLSRGDQRTRWASYRPSARTSTSSCRSSTRKRGTRIGAASRPRTWPRRGGERVGDERAGLAGGGVDSKVLPVECNSLLPGPQQPDGFPWREGREYLHKRYLLHILRRKKCVCVDGRGDPKEERRVRTCGPPTTAIPSPEIHIIYAEAANTTLDSEARGA